MLQYVWQLSHLQSYSRTYTTASRPNGEGGIVVNIDSNVALYMIKPINMNKLIWCVNDISNCGQAYLIMCLINKVIYILTPGHKRRHHVLLAKMGL